MAAPKKKRPLDAETLTVILELARRAASSVARRWRLPDEDRRDLEADAVEVGLRELHRWRPHWGLSVERFLSRVLILSLTRRARWMLLPVSASEHPARAGWHTWRRAELHTDLVDHRPAPDEALARHRLAHAVRRRMQHLAALDPTGGGVLLVVALAEGATVRDAGRDLGLSHMRASWAERQARARLREDPGLLALAAG